MALFIFETLTTEKTKVIQVTLANSYLLFQAGWNKEIMKYADKFTYEM